MRISTDISFLRYGLDISVKVNHFAKKDSKKGTALLVGHPILRGNSTYLGDIEIDTLIGEEKYFPALERSTTIHWSSCHVSHMVVPAEVMFEDAGRLLSA